MLMLKHHQLLPLFYSLITQNAKDASHCREITGTLAETILTPTDWGLCTPSTLIC